MEKTLPLFSKEALIAELRALLVNFASVIGPVYGFANTYKMLPVLTPEDHASADDMPFDKHLASLDIMGLPVTQELIKLYDYGFFGVNAQIEWDVLAQDIYPFFASLKHFYPLQFDDFIVLPEGSYTKCMHVLDLAAARSELTGDDPDSFLDFTIKLTGGTPVPDGLLPLKHVALLAGIDEKTVRNLAGPSAKNPLPTKSVANRTYVTIQDAKQWLRARGNVVESTYVASSGKDRDLARNGFASTEDFHSFVTTRLQSLQRADPVHSDLTAGDVERLDAIRLGRFDYDLPFWVRVAQHMQIDPIMFSEAALKLHHACQLEELQLAVRATLNPEYGSW